MRSTAPLLLVAALLSGCATVTKGTHENVMVITDPPGASAFTDIPMDKRDLSQGYLGCAPTPCSIRLPRQSEAVIELNHPDYAPYEAAVFTDVREVREYRETQRAQLLDDNAKVATGVAGSYFVAGSLDAFGTVVFPSAGVGIVLLGSTIAMTAGAGTLVGNATDTMSGAANSLYPNPLAVRLSKSSEDYPKDPNVEGVRQRRKRPSPKPPLGDGIDPKNDTENEDN